MMFFSTLVIGGAGSVMLELYGWESVFYISGILAVLWAYCMWKCMLKGEGKSRNCDIESWHYLPGLVRHFDILQNFFFFFFNRSLCQTTGNNSMWFRIWGSELRSLISPHLCTTQCLKSNANTHTLCFLDGWVGAESTVSAASVQAVISQLVSCTFSRRPRVCQRVFVDPCLQGQSSRWSHWGAGDPSPNCQKGTGYVSSNSLLSGEVTKKVAKGQT